MTEPKDKCPVCDSVLVDAFCENCCEDKSDHVQASIIARLREENAKLREACHLAADFIDGFVVDLGAGAQDAEAEAAHKALVSALKDSQ